ncbi:DUF4097 family beta strand repeat-containing protein [Amycolatopsis samaneae]|uniref:Adhesin domain-containing protein n=1 Tax=Amycolatopsis samaneae TaxID=664691 RepID=A0ABW5GFV6_9PSEU
MRIGWVAAAGVMVASLSACQAGVAGEIPDVGWQHTVKDTATLAGPAEAVKIDGSAGYVRLRSGGAPGSITVEREIHYRGTKPEGVWHRLAGPALELDGRCGTACVVSYTVTLPDRVAVHGKIDAGEFDADKVGSLDLTMSAGSLRVRDCAGPVKAVTSVGEVDIAMSAAADVSVKSEVGAVSLAVPGRDYAVSTHTAVGVRNGTLPDRQTGAHRIEVSTTTGAIRLDSR